MDKTRNLWYGNRSIFVSCQPLMMKSCIYGLNCLSSVQTRQRKRYTVLLDCSCAMREVSAGAFTQQWTCLCGKNTHTYTNTQEHMCCHTSMHKGTHYTLARSIYALEHECTQIIHANTHSFIFLVLQWFTDFSRKNNKASFECVCFVWLHAVYVCEQVCAFAFIPAMLLWLDLNSVTISSSANLSFRAQFLKRNQNLRKVILHPNIYSYRIKLYFMNPPDIQKVPQFQEISSLYGHVV